MAKTEAELIATVATINEASACLLFGERAKSAGMFELAAACENRARELKPLRASRHRDAPPGPQMKTHLVSEQALALMIEDYNSRLPTTTYHALAERCGFPGQNNARWFGQVTDLIDAACALAGVPSFALVRVRESDGKINDAAWRKEHGHLRDRIVARAVAGVWTNEDFMKIKDALAIFSARRLGNKKAWNYVFTHIKIEEWAG